MLRTKCCKNRGRIASSHVVEKSGTLNKFATDAGIMVTMKEVTIFGSCISRDVFQNERDGLSLRAYFARSSWISATSLAHPLPPISSKLSSPFQQRMLNYDIKSAVLPQIEMLEGQLLMLDLIDERAGVLQLSDSQFITDLAELRHSGWRDTFRSKRKIDFGTTEHFEKFCKAIPQVLKRTEHLEKIVIKSSFASYDSNGTPLAPYSGRSSEEWNLIYRPYFDALEANGLRVMAVPEDLCIADADHQWGTAPYHYIPGFYDWIADKLTV